MKIAIDYQPEALEVGDKPKFVSATDGDTPTLEMPVRMLGMDAPELHYGGATGSNPGKYDIPFSTFLSKQGAGLDDELKDYLAKRLDDGASTRHIEAGRVAFMGFGFDSTNVDRINLKHWIPINKSFREGLKKSAVQVVATTYRMTEHEVSRARVSLGNPSFGSVDGTCLDALRRDFVL